MNEIYIKNVLEKFQSVEWIRQQAPAPNPIVHKKLKNKNFKNP
jgi:hypothetical protein